MGKKWDGAGTSFDPETWKKFMPHLHDGAFGLAFAGSRGWHRMAVAIEDAGFIIHPSIFTWISLSGFPKAVRIDDQIDALLGNEQPVVGKMAQYARNGPQKTRCMSGGWNESPDVKEPVSDEAKAFAGHRYGLQAMRPLVEPVILFQKPYSGKPVRNMLDTGAGALNLEGAKIGDEVRTSTPGKPGGHEIYGAYAGLYEEQTYVGRLPPNFAIVHSLFCTTDYCFCMAMDGQLSDELKYYAEFHWHHEVYERIATANPSMYAAKSSRKERDAGLNDMPTQLMKNKLTSHNGQGDFRSVDGKPLAKGRNIHPTAKPLSMAKWLATLLLPPDMYAPRKLLVPFSGSGSEMIGAMLAGWEDITGLEFEEEYVVIAGTRLAWWESQMKWHGGDLDKILEGVVLKPEEKPVDTLPLFSYMKDGTE